MTISLDAGRRYSGVSQSSPTTTVSDGLGIAAATQLEPMPTQTTRLSEQVTALQPVQTLQGTPPATGEARQELSPSSRAAPFATQRHLESRESEQMDLFPSVFAQIKTHLPAGSLDPMIFPFFIPTTEGLRKILKIQCEKKNQKGTLRREDAQTIQVFENPDSFFSQAQSLESNQRLIGIIQMRGYDSLHYTMCVAVHSKKGLSFLQSDSFSSNRYHLRAPKDARFFSFSLFRQADGETCWIFALKDACYFATFSIEDFEHLLATNENGMISQYPSKLMKGCQHSALMEAHKKTHPQEATQLEASLEKHRADLRNYYTWDQRVKYLVTLLEQEFPSFEEELSLLYLFLPCNSHHFPSKERMLSLLTKYQSDPLLVGRLFCLSSVQQFLKDNPEILPPIWQFYRFQLLKMTQAQLILLRKLVVTGACLSQDETGTRIKIALSYNSTYSVILLKLFETNTISEEERGEAVIEASKTGDLKILEVLLANGPISEVDRGKAVIESSRSKKSKVLKVLLANGPISEMDREKAVKSALYKYYESNHSSVAIFLIDLLRDGSIPEDATTEVLSFVAISFPSLELIQLAIEKGKISDETREQAVLKALQWEHLTILDFLLGTRPISDETRAQAAIEASRLGHLNTLTYLLETGHISDETRAKAVIEASRCGHLNILTYLLETGPISDETRAQAVLKVAQQSSSCVCEENRHKYFESMKLLLKEPIPASCREEAVKVANPEIAVLLK